MSSTENNAVVHPLVEPGQNARRADLSLLDEAMAGCQGQNTILLPILEQAQELYGYLSLEVLQHIASRLAIPVGKVYGVATFYTELRVRRAGRHVLQVCDGLSCYLSGGGSRLLPYLSCRLGIGPGGTTSDGCFTLETVQCLACCDEAPAMRVGERLYQHLTTARVEAILEELQAEA